MRSGWGPWICAASSVISLWGCGPSAQGEDAENSPPALDQAQNNLSTEIFRLAAAADVFVSETEPNTNFARSERLWVSGTPGAQRESALRFVLPPGRRATSARLRLFAAQGSPQGFSVWNTSGPFPEYVATWNSRPQSVGPGVSGAGPVASNSWVELDVTYGISQGVVSLLLRPSGQESLAFHSRESSQSDKRPQLVVVTEAADPSFPAAPPPPPEFVPPGPPSQTVDGCLTRTEVQPWESSAFVDGYVSADTPTVSLERRAVLRATTNPQREIVMTFGPPPARVSRATLRMFVEGGTSNGPKIFKATVPGTPITWNSRPQSIGAPVADLGKVVGNNWIEVDVTGLLPTTPTDNVNLLMRADSSDEVSFVSTEGVSTGVFSGPLEPRLVYTVESEPFCSYRGTFPEGTVTASRKLGTVGDDSVIARAYDANGNWVTLGGTSSGPQMVVTRYGPDGVQQWERSFTAPGLRPSAVALTSLGNVLVTGQYDGQPNLGVGALPAQQMGLFIAKLGPNGMPVWSKGFGAVINRGEDSSPGAIYPRALATDAQGSLIVTGAFFGEMNLGSGPLDAGNGSRALDDAWAGLFLAKFSWEGTSLWSRAAVGNGLSSAGASLAIAPSGDVFLGGTVTAQGDLGGGPTGGQGGPFVARYGAAGNHLWSRVLQGARGEIQGLWPAGESVGFAGVFHGQFEMGGTTYAATPSEDVGAEPNDDLVVGRLEATGAPAMVRTIGNAGIESLTDLTADASGNLIVSGHFQGSLDFGGPIAGPIGRADVANNAAAPFLLELNPQGQTQWARVFDYRLGGLKLVRYPAGLWAIGEFDQTLELSRLWYTPTGLRDLLLLRVHP